MSRSVRWFDEVNPEVLWVCSVQSKAVCDACKADDEVLLLEEDCINLDPTVGAFITMNPGSIRASRRRQSIVPHDDGHDPQSDADFLW